MKKLHLFILIISLSAIAVSIFIYRNVKSNEDFVLTRKANHSSGTYWEMTLENNDVISLKKYSEIETLIGPGYTQSWEFDILKVGEFTINWKYYSGDVIVSDKCYTEKYTIEEDYTVSHI